MVAESFLRQFVQAEWKSFPRAHCPDHRRGRARRRDVGCARRAVSHRLVFAARRRSRRGSAQSRARTSSLTGPVELRLLPTPYLALGEGLVSAPGPDGAKLSFASARLELALVKLASGQIRFSDIRLEKPVLTLTRGPDGALKLPPVQMAGLHSTGFDRLSDAGRAREDRRRRRRNRDFRRRDRRGRAVARRTGASERPVFRPGRCSRRLLARLGKTRTGRDAAPPRSERRSELAGRAIRRRPSRRPRRAGSAAFGSPARPRS